MVPAFAAEAPKAKRLGFIYLPNGVAKNFTGINYWTPKGKGKHLRALDDSRAARAVSRPADRHQRHRIREWPRRTRRTARRAITRKRTRRGSPACAASAPRAPTSRAACRPISSRRNVLGKETVLPSLELSIDLSVLAGMCDSAYSCVYLNTLSWSSPTTPLPTREQSACRVRALVRQRRHERATRGAGAPEPQHPRLRRRRFRALDARARARGSRASRRVSRAPCAKSSGGFRRSRSSATRPDLPALERPRGIPETVRRARASSCTSCSGSRSKRT